MSVTHEAGERAGDPQPDPVTATRTSRVATIARRTRGRIEHTSLLAGAITASAGAGVGGAIAHLIDRLAG